MLWSKETEEQMKSYFYGFVTPVNHSESVYPQIQVPKKRVKYINLYPYLFQQQSWAFLRWSL